MIYDIPFEIGDFVTVKANVRPFREEVVKLKSINISKDGIFCDVWHAYGEGDNPFFIRTYMLSSLKKAKKPDYWDEYCRKYKYENLI